MYIYRSFSYEIITNFSNLYTTKWELELLELPKTSKNLKVLGTGSITVTELKYFQIYF